MRILHLHFVGWIWIQMLLTTKAAAADVRKHVGSMMTVALMKITSPPQRLGSGRFFSNSSCFPRIKWINRVWLPYELVVQVDQFVDAFFGETARGVDGRSPDWNMGKVENYQRIDAWLEVGSPDERKKYPQKCLCYEMSFWEWILGYEAFSFNITYLKSPRRTGLNDFKCLSVLNLGAFSQAPLGHWKDRIQNPFSSEQLEFDLLSNGTTEMSKSRIGSVLFFLVRTRSPGVLF